MNQELFAFSLNEEGKNQLLRLYPKVKIIFIGGLVWAAVTLLSTIVQMRVLLTLTGFSGRESVRLMEPAIYTATSLILFTFQGYYYFHFSKLVKKGIEEQNSFTFNGAFRLLNINAILTIISLALSFLHMVYSYLRLMHY